MADRVCRRGTAQPGWWLLVGVLGAASGWRFGAGIEAVAMIGLGTALARLSLIDIERRLLPDRLVLPLLWTGLVLNAGGVFTPPAMAILGAALGYLSLEACRRGYRRLRGREGLGGGDVKLFAALGAWLGCGALAPVLALAAPLGLLWGVLARSGAATIPFGPCLALAGWGWLWWHGPLGR